MKKVFIMKKAGKNRARAKALSIGQLAEAAGTSVQTVRWYEQQGLLPEPARSEGGQRRYDDATLRRLVFIRHARELGLTLNDIRALLELADNPAAPCEEADAIIRRELARVREKIAQLKALEQEFTRMLEECPAQEVRTCRIIEILSDHAQCLHPEHPGPDDTVARKKQMCSRSW